MKTAKQKSIAAQKIPQVPGLLGKTIHSFREADGLTSGTSIGSDAATLYGVFAKSRNCNHKNRSI
jgi:hypothetical protein